MSSEMMLCVTYGEGGLDADAENGNVVEVLVQEIELHPDTGARVAIVSETEVPVADCVDDVGVVDPDAAIAAVEGS